MKVMLLSANVASTPYPVYPLGMSMVARALVDAGHEVRQYDYLHLDGFEKCGEAIKAFSPEAIGISIRNIDNVNILNEKRYIAVVTEMIASIKKQCAVPVIVGGSGFSIMPELLLDIVGADYGIVGEGEWSMVALISTLAAGGVPDEKCIKSKTLLSDTSIPSALYDKDIMSFYLKGGNVASVQTKRGCDHHCVYCTYPFLEGHSIRMRDPKSVVDDIEALISEHGAQFIFFTDSVFNDDKDRYLEIVQEMKRRGVCVPWTAFFKPDGLSAEVIALMKETGLAAAEIGADASTDITLKGLGKSFSFDNVRRTNDLFNEQGIATAHYYMFGGPGETPETVKEGIDNILSMKKTASFIFMGIRILPGTSLVERAIREGIISKDCDLVDSVYYIAPGLDHDWLFKTLEQGFKGVRHCVFPPDALESSLKFMHKLGYSGLLWDMLIPKK